MNFAGNHDKMNVGIVNNGVVISRYTGSAGKSGSSEAGVEFLDILRRAVEREIYQFAELGEVDIGGGGTTAKILAQQLNAHVIDIGVGVMNMHSPFEVIGIADLWACVELYKYMLIRK